MTLALRGRRLSSRRRGELLPWLLLIPAGIVILGAHRLARCVQLVIISFQEFGRAQIFGTPPNWVGSTTTPRCSPTRRSGPCSARSIAFALVNVVTTMLLGILIALLMTRLNRGLQAAGLGRPAAGLGDAADHRHRRVGLDVRHRLRRRQLRAHHRLRSADSPGHSWLIEPLSFFFVATVIITWQSVPFVAFTMFAGLTQVPDEVLEAAELDGVDALPALPVHHLPVPAARCCSCCCCCRSSGTCACSRRSRRCRRSAASRPRPTRSASYIYDGLDRGRQPRRRRRDRRHPGHRDARPLGVLHPQHPEAGRGMRAPHPAPDARRCSSVARRRRLPVLGVPRLLDGELGAAADQRRSRTRRRTSGRTSSRCATSSASSPSPRAASSSCPRSAPRCS